MKITPAKRLKGTIRVPGDKSISHRAVMLGSLCEGDVRIKNFAASRDCLSTVECMRALGVEIDVDGTNVLVHGVGKNGLKRTDGPLDCGNSGTTMRLLAGILAGQDFDSVLDGDDSLRCRPMKRIIEPLTQMGAKIASVDGHAPLKIKGGQSLHGIVYETPVPSAQVKSCVQLAGRYADGGTRVVESTSTRDHTALMLSWLDRGESSIDVPGDISSAAYSIVAAACLPGSSVLLESVGLNPTRSRLLDVLADAGVDLTIINKRHAGLEPIGDVRVVGDALERGPLKISGATVAEVIDEIPILAVLGTQLPDGFEVRDASELRVKESDRIASVVTNLKQMNADVTETDDGFVIKRSDLKGAVVDSFGDHRIAMAFAIAGLLAEGETEIVGADCVDVSYPGFFDDLESVTER